MNMITRAAAARWLQLPASERGNAGLMAPSHDLRERLEAATGKRIAALEAVEPEREKGRRSDPVHGRAREDSASDPGPRTPEPEKACEPRGIEMEI